MPKIYVCKHCGSPRVTREALVDVNGPALQAHALYDMFFCPDCETEGKDELLDEVEVPDDFNMASGFYALDDVQRNARIIEIARERVAFIGDDIEINDDAKVAEGGDNGAFVQAWVWARFEGTELDKEPQ